MPASLAGAGFFVGTSADGRTLIVSRYTELNTDQKLLVKQLKFDLPSQPPPRITASPERPTRVMTQPM